VRLGRPVQRVRQRPDLVAGVRGARGVAAVAADPQGVRGKPAQRPRQPARRDDSAGRDQDQSEEAGPRVRCARAATGSV
jgi:hypothetical protein